MADDATPPAAGSGAKAVKAAKAGKEPFGVVPSSDLAKPYDCVVIGGGPAGVAAAQKAAFLGRRTLIIDNAPCCTRQASTIFETASLEDVKRLPNT